MKNRQLLLTLGIIITGTVIVLSSCKKINEATELGGDLIPPIDNINTFDTTLTVEAYNDLFTLTNVDPLKTDSTISHYTYEQFLGRIDNDLFFGKTEAEMYFEIKPASYPFTFKNKPHPDSLKLDSVVLILDYLETYGDTTVAQQFSVYEITSKFGADTNFLMRKISDITTAGLPLNSNYLNNNIFPYTLNDTVKAYQDTTSHQLRLRLDNSFGDRLLYSDTTAAGPNNAFYSDSVFKSKFKGFAVKSTGPNGNAVMGFNLQGANTKLAIYYHYLHGTNTGDYDTTVAYFGFKAAGTFGTKQGSGSHNYVNRDYSGTPLLAAQGGTTPDPIVYIQGTPGTFATLKIPGLGALNNRVIHRAELIAEQLYHISDSTFPRPTLLFLDAYIPSISKYQTIPYDVIFDGSSFTYNLNSFGLVPINALDAGGNVVKTWHFNLSRYVQHVVNNTDSVYDLRLFAPVQANDYYRTPVNGSTPAFILPVSLNPDPVKGRIRLVGSTGPLDPNPHRLRMRIIYSKL